MTSDMTSEKNPQLELRNVGDTSLQVTPVAMGCWPIAGITSIDVNESDSLATLVAARASGINFFDTAYNYGRDGESERLIRKVFGDGLAQLVIATKAGLTWSASGDRQHDASPASIRAQFEASCERLQRDVIDLYYLHAPDPNVPIERSAEVYAELLERGSVRAVGVSNVNVDQLRAFQRVCPVSAVQPHYNMLQREIEAALIPYCQSENISVIVYWPLMKGLLAGKLQRDHIFAPHDGRAKYPMFQGEEWERNQDFVDELRRIAEAIGKSVTQVVINWTIHRTGITAALCGAKRSYQIEESAGAMGWRLSPEQLESIDRAIRKRGPIVTKAAV